MNRLQSRAAASGPPRLHTGTAHSPMDLVCERLAHWIPRRRGGDRVALQCESDHRVHLPNPRYPMPVSVTLRLHCPQPFAAARAWGEPGPDALDLALNVMAAYLPFRISDRAGALRVADGAIVSRQAARFYRAFCADFLVPMAADGAIVREETIRDWLREREFSAELAA